MADLVRVTAAFTLADPEEGRRGQALLAAAMAIAHGPEVVTTAAVNDPSRRIPGDVVVWDRPSADGAAKVVAIGEAKQRPVTDAYVLVLCEKAAAVGIPSVVYLAMHPSQAPIDVAAVVAQRYGVALSVFTDPQALLYSAIVWSGRHATSDVMQFPEVMRQYLQVMSVSAQAIEEWARANDRP
jgi:hypothetical protein